jgi:hypothetical protein
MPPEVCCWVLGSNVFDMNIRHNRKGTRRIRIISKIGKEPVIINGCFGKFLS